MAVTKETYDYSAKNEVRERFKNFISEAYPSESQRKDLSVLTLMGHETTELEQVWEPLGIPRENITSVENNRDAYRSLAQQNPGINLVYSSIENFLAETDDVYDIVNLDYNGTYNFSKVQLLKDIGYTRFLGDEGILSTWYSGARESKIQREKIERQWDLDKEGHLERIKNNYEKFKNHISKKQEMDLLLYIEDQEKKIERRSPKDEVISTYICDVLDAGITNFQASPVVDKLNIWGEYLDYIGNLKSFKSRNENFLRAIECGARSLKQAKMNFGYSGHTEEAFNSFKRIRNEENVSKEQEREDIKKLYESFHSESRIFLHEKISHKIKKELESSRIGHYEKNFHNIISHFLLSRENESYWIENAERFKYHSNNRVPMYADFFKAGTPDYSPISDISLKKNGRIKIPKHKGNKMDFIEFVQDTGKKSSSRNPNNWPDREYIENRENLGSIETIPKNNPDKIQSQKSSYNGTNSEKSKAPKKQKSNPNKEVAVEWIKEGHDINEILEAFPGEFTKGQLSSYKAHITMGTYK